MLKPFQKHLIEPFYKIGNYIVYSCIKVTAIWNVSIWISFVCSINGVVRSTKRVFLIIKCEMRL